MIEPPPEVRSSVSIDSALLLPAEIYSFGTGLQNGSQTTPPEFHRVIKLIGQGTTLCMALSF